MKKKTQASAPDINALIAAINKDLGDGRVVIQRGSDVGWLQADRLSTGSLGLDIALNGGVPRGMITQFMGEESSGKTTMAFKLAGEVQNRFGEDAAIAFVAVEGFNKKWANQCGCAIPFSKAELKKMPPEDAEAFALIDEIGHVVVAQATTGEDALELALRFLRSGLFHLVVVDSLAALVPSVEQEAEMQEQTMGQQPRLIGRFLRKCYAAYNTPCDDGSANMTALLLINQVREVIGSYGHPEPQPPGGRGLRHALSVSVRFRKGELLKEGDKDTKLVYGKRTKTRIEKSKVGPPFREAEFDFYFQAYGTFSPGDIDVCQEARIWGVRAGVITQIGNRNYDLDGEKFNGKDRLEEYLRANDEVLQQVRRLTLRALTSGG